MQCYSHGNIVIADRVEVLALVVTSNLHRLLSLSLKIGWPKKTDPFMAISKDIAGLRYRTFEGLFVLEFRATNSLSTTKAQQRSPSPN